MDIYKNLKTAYRRHFKNKYGKLLLADNVDVYMNYMLGKNLDLGFVSNSCDVFISESPSNRSAFSYQFEFVYDCRPTDEQLDVFISFRNGIIKDSKLLSDVCSLKNNTQSEPLNG